MMNPKPFLLPTTKIFIQKNQDHFIKKIGFLTENTDPTLQPQAEQTNTTEIQLFAPTSHNCFHFAVSAFVIVVFRTFFITENHTIPILSQLQDFVMGSIGFLVGYNKYHVK